MYKEHPVFEKPEDLNSRIWRYMDFTKFISLLEYSSLYFSRIDKLDDAYEGSYPKLNSKLKSATWSFIDEDKFKGHLEGITRYRKSSSKFHFVNSWHLNNYESAGMWKLYLKSNEGIAIQSTFGRLKNGLKDKEHNIFIGKIKYIDYETGMIPKEGNVLTPFIYKRKSFKHEQELRALIWKLPIINNGIDFSGKSNPDGLYIKVDLDTLLEKVYLAPTSPKWLNELVNSVISKYKLDKEVFQSSLNGNPVY